MLNYSKHYLLGGVYLIFINNSICHQFKLELAKTISMVTDNSALQGLTLILLDLYLLFQACFKSIEMPLNFIKKKIARCLVKPLIQYIGDVYFSYI